MSHRYMSYCGCDSCSRERWGDLSAILPRPASPTDPGAEERERELLGVIAGEHEGRLPVGISRCPCEYCEGFRALTPAEPLHDTENSDELDAFVKDGMRVVQPLIDAAMSERKPTTPREP